MAPAREPLFSLQRKNSLLAININNTHNKAGTGKNFHTPAI
jgi:hypothetical protein